MYIVYMYIHICLGVGYCSVLIIQGIYVCMYVVMVAYFFSQILHGADVKLKNQEGQTPYNLAAVSAGTHTHTHTHTHQGFIQRGGRPGISPPPPPPPQQKFPPPQDFELLTC